MPVTIPPLVPRPRSRAMHLLGRMLPGVRATSAQIGPFTAAWDEWNRAGPIADSDHLLVAIGDSTALGIGASRPDRSYVARVAQWLEQHRGEPVRVVNLALSGARVQDALDRQLPILDGLDPDLVLCCIGSNDITWSLDTKTLRHRLTEMVERLPPVAVVGLLAGGSARTHLANRTLRAAASDRGLPVVNPWNEPGPPRRQRLSADRFHPNDLGYELMAASFARKLGIPVGSADRPDPPVTDGATTDPRTR